MTVARKAFMLRTTVAALALLAALAVLAAPGQAATHTIAVGYGGDDRMSPRASTVNQGDTVVFTWQDGGHDLVLAGPEGTRVSEQDEDFRLTRPLYKAGDYTFMCTLHDNMDATLKVAPVSGAPDRLPQVDVVVGPDGDGGIEPAEITVGKGQTVAWHCGDDKQSVSFADGQGSGSRSIGALWTRTFDTVGTYTYNGGGAAGKVTVTEKPPGGASGSTGIAPAAAGTSPAAQVSVGGGGNSFSPNNVTIDEGQA